MTSLSHLGPGTSLPPYQVTAHNAAEESENRIHNTDVAKQYGFAGGLVPGVTVYAYMTRPVVEALGLAWVDHGRMDVRLLKPFYEGEQVTVTAAVRESATGTVTLDISATNGRDEVCATGVASLDAQAPTPPAVDAFPASPLPARRPPVSYEALAARDVLGSLEEVVTAESVAAYLDEVADDLAHWRGPGAVVPAGYLVRRANTVLSANVYLSAWIHVSSEVSHFGMARPGDQLSTRGRVLALFERKGHKFVDVDVLMLADGVRPLMRVHHTAIYDIRRVASV